MSGTKHTRPTPTARAMRAADAVELFVGCRPYGDSHDEEALKVHAEWKNKLAEKIDRETKLPEVLAALNNLLADVMNLGSSSITRRQSVSDARAVIAAAEPAP